MNGRADAAPGPGGAAGGEVAPRPERVTPPDEGEAWTVLHMIRWSGQYLEEKGVEGGRLDAEHLLAAALGTERLQLYLEFDRPLTREELDAYRPLLRRRGEREPLQYVLGRTSFRELELRVDPRALIPRPETEVLVGAVLEWAAGEERDDLTALDVGTGTGAIALSLAREGPFRRVVATDRSEDALALARENAAEVGVADRVEPRAGDLFEAVDEGESFDAVVSNPPYVARDEVDDLEPEVREWEPADALVAGPEGTETIARLVAEAAGVLRAGGLLAVEIGDGQGDRARALVREAGSYGEPEVRHDLAGRERILLAVRR